jgi:hypothetical protein
MSALRRLITWFRTPVNAGKYNIGYFGIYPTDAKIDDKYDCGNRQRMSKTAPSLNQRSGTQVIDAVLPACWRRGGHRRSFLSCDKRFFTSGGWKVRREEGMCTIKGPRTLSATRWEDEAR